MKLNRLFAVLIALFTLSGALVAQKLPEVKYTEFRLKNGLRVILHEDHSTPIVATNVWYHVGSKDEVPGRTGFAHLFEHMMFQGSKNYDADYFTPLQEAGGSLNGSTSRDRTNYWEVVPSNFLERAIFLEADRMGGLLEAMTLAKLNNQRDVVKNEKRQNYDNQPYGLAGANISAILYPKEHPYHWLTIGSLDDLSAASMDDVKNFFRQYYVPNNASLVIAGDFDPKQARAWVEKYFGPIPRGADVKRPNPAQPKLEKEVRASFEDSIAPLPRLYIAWHTVPEYSKDDAALSMLANILSSGRGSRFQSSIVYGKELAQDAIAGQQSGELAGRFQLFVTPRPGKTLADMEKAVDAEIERIKSDPPTDAEMRRALNSLESNWVFGLQSVGGFGGKADQLNAYATFLNNPNYFDQDLDRYRKVTPADVQRVAKTYLTANRLVVSYMPSENRGNSTATTASADNPTSTESSTNKAVDASKLPQPGPDPKLRFPAIERSKLSNGLPVVFVKHNELPIVSMRLIVRSGSVADPAGKNGVASFTSTLLNRGTKTRTAEDISNQMQTIGATGGTNSDLESSTMSIQTLSKNFDAALDIFADVALNPAFPSTELETVRRRSLVSLVQRRRNANAVAGIAYSSVLYGGSHPYGVTLTEASVKSVTEADIRGFYEANYRPNNAALIVVGDIDRNALMQKLERAFGGWRSSDVRPVSLTAPVASTRSSTIYLVDRPGSAQSVINIGQVGIERNNPDYYPLLVMNSILGGGFTSRINMNLREDKGYTYGARSNFDWRRGPGPFTASGGVQTAVTKESVMEFLKELRGIRGDIPITPQELAYNKQSLIRRYPAAFETTGQIANQLSTLFVQDLPDSYFNDHISRINAVTLADVNRVAAKYLDPSKMAIVIVGDRKVIEPKLSELGMPIVVLDADGNPVTK